MNTLSLVTRSLRFRPSRTLFLLLGFAVGVMVMVVLLSVGSAVLEQAMDEDLTGGGDIVLLPVGIDVATLKTGGVTSMHFDIPNARFLTREILSPRRLPAGTRVSPELTRAYLTLAHDGQEHLIRADGVVPSRQAALHPDAVIAGLQDGDGERDYIDPDFTALLTRIDAFHPPVLDTTQTWAEWHYFNYHDERGRSLYISINALAWSGDVAPGGYSRGMVLFEFVDENGRQTKVLEVLPGSAIAASHESPDLLAGLNAVRLDGGVYTVHVSLADSLARPITVSLEVTPTPHLYMPPLTPMGSEVAFGYVVPVVRGRASGRVTMGGQTWELDGTGYHDHNWGHFRNAVWDWGIVHLARHSILYGRFANSAGELSGQPVLVALFDEKGARPFVLTGDYSVRWEDAVPQGVDIGFTHGTERLTLSIEVQRRFVSETGGGEQPLFRADETARSFFFQLQGRARLKGSLEGHALDEAGHAYSETFRVDPR